jgi:type IV pilus assembly protein PilV
MHMRTNRTSARRSAVGYALLEALVAVIVAAVGFIGAARMQTLGMSLGNSAQSRQKATLLGYQMTDRIRANRLGFENGQYNNPTNDLTAGATACLGAGCTPTQMAVADVSQWAAELATALPAGTGKVCIDSTPEDGTSAAPACDGVGNVIAIKIWWTDNVAATRFVTVVRP